MQTLTPRKREPSKRICEDARALLTCEHRPIPVGTTANVVTYHCHRCGATRFGDGEWQPTSLHYQLEAALQRIDFASGEFFAWENFAAHALTQSDPSRASYYAHEMLAHWRKARERLFKRPTRRA